MENLKERVEALRKNFKEALNSVGDLEGLERLRVRFLGRKGEITLLFKLLKELSPDERREAGFLLNTLKEEVQEALNLKREELKKVRGREKIDLTLPGREYPLGGIHPLTAVLEELIDIFVGLGFTVEEGPEIEWDFYNFEALNIPPHHPARDMWSTLFITEKMMLRTHTSPVQIRVMERKKPPLRFISPGRVYRKDAFDASHSPAFYQLEGLYVDRKVTFSDLKGTLEVFARELFGPETRVKFVPSYFPFTEPSAEMSVNWGKGWLELVGCGMVHPAVFRAVGLDPEEWTGYAFGVGVDRVAMIKLGVDDIRLFYENDLRFLRRYLR
ncbi:MAG: phenylalanine--tRNA ligase subunit alpha [Candidatus Hydrothermae bacterium]|nr:phenylalanine--tRNA ligase subunit alpha [Candidatus Hydrothermae bacterium]